MEQTARAYGLDHQFLALPNHVQVGSPTGEGIYIANPDFVVRFDQSFALARLVAQASYQPNTPPTVLFHRRHSAARHPQHRDLHRDPDFDDVDRRRPADRAAAVAGGDPADAVIEPAGAP